VAKIQPIKNDAVIKTKYIAITCSKHTSIGGATGYDYILAEMLPNNIRDLKHVFGICN
jgi:hypothetical protein